MQKCKPKCLNCKNRVKQFKNKCCSLQCAGLVKRTRRQVQCLQCKIFFWAEPHTIKSGRKKFCSAKCRRVGIFTPEIRAKMSNAHKGKIRLSQRKEKHYKWKGDEAKYSAMHMLLRKYFGKANQCENRENKIMLFNCRKKSKAYQWAKIKEHKYSRNKEDYYQLCASCHLRYDRNWK